MSATSIAIQNNLTKETKPAPNQHDKSTAPLMLDSKSYAEDNTKALIATSRDLLIKPYGQFEGGIVVRKGGKMPSIRRGAVPIQNYHYFTAIGYYYGIGESISYSHALYYFGQNNDDPDSLYHMGLCYLYKQPRDLDNAFKYFKMASERGHLDAMVDYAICLENGFGTEANPPQAYDLYHIAAEAGEPRAQYFLASLLSQKRIDLAIPLLTRAADQHLSAAQWALGKCYEEGKGGLIKDDNKALELYKKAALKGEKSAIAALGAKPNNMKTQQGIQWAAIAQNSADSRALFEIALRFRKGKGMPCNIPQAIIRFEALIKANLSDVSRHIPGWHYNRHADLMQIITHEITAMEQLGQCYQETWEQQALPGAAQGLIPFYFIQEAKKRKEAIDRRYITHVMSEAERDASTLGKFNNPFIANPKFNQFLTLLKSLAAHSAGQNDPNIHFITMDGVDSLILTEQQHYPNQTLVLWHKGTGDIVINVTELSCANLFVISEQGNIQIKITSILNITGESFCLAADIAGGKIQINDAAINTGHAFACIASGGINITTKTMGEITCKLAVLLSPNTELDLQREDHILNRLTATTPNDVKDYLNKILEIMHFYLKPRKGPEVKKDLKVAVETSAATKTMLSQQILHLAKQPTLQPSASANVSAVPATIPTSIVAPLVTSTAASTVKLN